MPARPPPSRTGACVAALPGELSGAPRYIKTATGRQVIDSRTARLPLRHRQVLLLCTGAHTVEALAAIFGQEVRDDLAGLLAQGYIRDAVADLPVAGSPETASASSATSAPSAPSASGGGQATAAALDAACAQAGAILGVLPAAPARPLLDACRSLPRREEDVLACLAATLALAVQTWGVRGALPHAEALAHLLPPLTVARLLDCLIELEIDAALVAHLYERFLSESRLDAEDVAPGQPS